MYVCNNSNNEAMNSKASKEEYMGGFGRMKGKGEMMQLYYKFKKHKTLKMSGII